ncbi:hypothetical protein FNF27_00206 [Cafeteria roenbergensis]|uniref:Uncharacterized protein n=1 Tax=Cafeteria roenbergensis TaxID=33653 RepID=A0A5A8EKB0_CAFRO|nr:hypothetical protein FNF27_00206 [Cafeteria roenbergensis]
MEFEFLCVDGAPPSAHTTLEWSCAGDKFAVAGDDAVRAYDSATLELLVVVPLSPPVRKAGRNALCVSWSPDGGRLLVLQRGADSCEVWEATGGRLAVLHATVAEFEDARFVGVDGRFVLTTSVLRVQSVMWDVDGGTSAALPPCKHAPGSLACSEDGSLIVYASRPATADELVVVALAQPKAGAGGAEGTSEATWRVLAALPLPTRDACKVWLCRSDTAALVLDDALADKALGKTVVLTPGEGRAFLLDVGEGFAVRAASWSPDGSKLLVHNGHEWQLGCLLAAQGGDGE